VKLELPLCLSTEALEAYRSAEVDVRVFCGGLKYEYVIRFIYLADFIPCECGPLHLAGSSLGMPCSHPGQL
jgi:hypothetical protein